MSNKKVYICIGTIVMIIVILTIIVGIRVNTKNELDTAIEMVKNGNYNEAYNFIVNTGNQEYITIIKEINTMVLIDRMESGVKQFSTIYSKATTILNSINRSKIDYTADDTLNRYVTKLDDYIEIKNKIPKEIIIDDINMTETYDLYFELLEFTREKMYDFLNYVGDNEYLEQLGEEIPKIEQCSINIESLGANYKFKSTTQDIYEKIQKYI